MAACTFGTHSFFTICEVIRDIEFKDTKLMHFFETFGKTRNKAIDIARIVFCRIKLIAVDQLTYIADSHNLGIIRAC